MRIGIQTRGSEGDVRPFLALASSLAKKGHHVTVVATTGLNAAYAMIASANGFTFSNLFDGSLVIISKDELLAACFNMSNPIRQAERVMKNAFDPLEMEVHQAALELCRNNDLVVGHFYMYPLRVAAAAAKVPRVSVNIVRYCIPSRHTCSLGLPDLGEWLYPLGWRAVKHYAVASLFCG